MNLESHINYIMIPELNAQVKNLSTFEKVKEVCIKVKENRYRSVCTRNDFLGIVRNNIMDNTFTRTVVIGYPDTKLSADLTSALLGASSKENKYEEMKIAILLGATEFEYALNQKDIHDKNSEKITDEIKGAINIADGKVIKFIIETGLLTNYEISYITKLICMCVSISFLNKILSVGLHKVKNNVIIKTSSGYVNNISGAKVENIRLIKNTIGKIDLTIEASVGITTKKQALEFIDAGASLIGITEDLKDEDQA